MQCSARNISLHDVFNVDFMWVLNKIQLDICKASIDVDVIRNRKSIFSKGEDSRQYVPRLFEPKPKRYGCKADAMSRNKRQSGSVG